MTMRKPSKSLDLWMNGHQVGQWSIDAGVDVLQYDSQWLHNKLGRPLSLSLPFTPGNLPHKGEKVRFYFENLLPDHQEVRNRVARRYKLKTADAYDLLREVGRDCVGALQILPAGEVPSRDQRVVFEPMNAAQVAAHIRSIAQAGPVGWQPDEEAPFRISIAGAQDKTALLHWNGQWGLPQGATPSTHILKPALGVTGGQQIDMRDSVENEWLCAQILEAYGLPVAACEILCFEDQKVLSVQRFDRRVWQGDQLMRLPQEDMCQATGTSPAQKYESDGGPGIDAIMKLLDSSTARERDRFTFFMAQLLFWMLAAVDGHAKNFSVFIKTEGRYEMTPLYDVISAYPYMGKKAHQLQPKRVKLAMAVRSKNTHWLVHHIARRHWVALGQRYGIQSPKGYGIEELLNKVVEHTPHAIATVQRKLPLNFPQTVSEPIFAGLQQAAMRLAESQP